MKKTLKSIVPIVLIAAVAAMALYALGVIGANVITQAHVKEYDGLTFTGGLMNGRFSGHGTIYFHGGERYEGSFSDGYFDGEGSIFGKSGNLSFTGVFDNGQILEGTLYTEEGEAVTFVRGETDNALIGGSWSYVGGFNDRGQFGEGHFTFSNGSVYIGGFSRGLANGEGVHMDSKGSVIYTGGFKDGMFDGYGKYISSEGWSYEGGFEDGLFNGEGLIIIGTESIRGIWDKGVQTARYE